MCLTSTVEPTSTGAPGPTPDRARRRRRPYLAAGLTVLVIGLGANLVLRLGNAHGAATTLSNSVPVPSSVSPATANLMGLEGLAAKKAAGFRLVDQNGHTVSLAQFRGHPVVLEFMDPHCTDICPIVSREFLAAYHDLGPAGRNVVFLAVNVNRYHLSVSAVKGFTEEQGLGAIPTWHFLTGNFAQLQPVWKAYGIYVHSRGPHGDVQHTSEVFFIDPSGQESFVASPTDDHTASGTAFLPLSQQAAWGRGISEVAKALG